jgi:cysteinyl-tRNA synthetase
MALKLFNTLTRTKEEFKSNVDGQVSMYSCGPTVYNQVHIGNLRASIFVDLLRRYLKYKGYSLNHVMNITDVDDKTIRDSQAQGKSLKEFTVFYTGKFLEDLKTLNCEIPEHLPRATDNIDEMVELIKTLLEKGHAYKTEKGDIYFKIESFSEYGKLANLDVEQLKKNADGRLDSSDEYEKENARDFALWKVYAPEDGDVFWNTEIGKGRPGWHVECSAMSRKILGETFDIHTGGVDLVFPHHTNEIAQSECASGHKYVNYWIHNAHLIVNGEKMSKSLGNFYTLNDLISKGYDSKAIRFELLRTHYRQQLDFREDELKQIPETLSKFYNFLDKLDEIKLRGDSNTQVSKFIDAAKKSFEESMDDDLNISGGLAAIFNFMNEINKLIAENKLVISDVELVRDVMMSFDCVLGVMNHEKGELSVEEKQLILAREEARKNKDWSKSDELRDKLKELGIIVEDTHQGTRWKRI